MSTFTYYLPTKIFFGWGSLASLPEVMTNEFPGKKRILLVTGRSSLRKEGKTDQILRLLKEHTVMLFEKVEANPTSQMVHEGMEQFRTHHCDMIIAVGGGSVLDAGKAMSILLTNEGTLESYQAGAAPVHPPVDFLAIPTTSGTSSEITTWSVITNAQGIYRDVKKSIGDPKMYPKATIIDPELTVSLPPYQTACTGLDALCHAIEGSLSKKRNPLSTTYALDAIRIIVPALPRAFRNGADREAREQMSLGALLAGLAFGNSRTMSPHKASYPLTTQFNLPHGAACALTLPSFLEDIGERSPELLAGITEAMGCRDYREMIQALRSLTKDLGLPTTLRELGAEKEDIAFIARKSYVPVDKQEDPLPIEEDRYLAILQRAF
ncbi:MAG: iron-containing alcohol dehydrogenase [Candidatus Peribacteraceae bacterium]|nr:iron-containing alcohol dehydrogenase [Candidatus Peribacteraceae bacterium]